MGYYGNTEDEGLTRVGVCVCGVGRKMTEVQGEHISQINYISTPLHPG